MIIAAYISLTTARSREPVGRSLSSSRITVTTTASPLNVIVNSIWQRFHLALFHCGSFRDRTSYWLECFRVAIARDPSDIPSAYLARVPIASGIALWRVLLVSTIDRESTDHLSDLACFVQIKFFRIS